MDCLKKKEENYFHFIHLPEYSLKPKSDSTMQILLSNIICKAEHIVYFSLVLIGCCVIMYCIRGFSILKKKRSFDETNGKTTYKL